MHEQTNFPTNNVTLVNTLSAAAELFLVTPPFSLQVHSAKCLGPQEAVICSSLQYNSIMRSGPRLALAKTNPFYGVATSKIAKPPSAF